MRIDQVGGRERAVPAILGPTVVLALLLVVLRACLARRLVRAIVRTVRRVTLELGDMTADRSAVVTRLIGAGTRRDEAEQGRGVCRARARRRGCDRTTRG